jgi:hypothetical protein
MGAYPFGNEPQGQAGVKAAGNRVFVHANVGGKKAYFQVWRGVCLAVGRTWLWVMVVCVLVVLKHERKAEWKRSESG